jgi:hypothetical protein
MNVKVTIIGSVILVMQLLERKMLQLSILNGDVKQTLPEGTLYDF